VIAGIKRDRRHRRHRASSRVIGGYGCLALSIARIDNCQTSKIENLSPTDSVDEINFGGLWQSWAILAIALSGAITMP